MGWPDGHTIVGNWNGKGNPSAEPRYHPRGPHRAPDGLAGRSHDRDGLADTLRVGGRASGAGDSYDNTPWVVNALDQRRGGPDDNEAQAGHLIAGTLREHVRPGSNTDLSVLTGGSGVNDDPLLSLGLDSHRYRCCGNGVVSDVSFWIGQRLAEIA